MKRLIICCDGTWQELSSPYPTNVVKMAQAIAPEGDDKIPQIIYYDPGVGTDDRFSDKIFGGAFGKGLDINIMEAYRFLSFNYTPDDEIYIFGFSRGAYTARSLAGLVNRVGILSRKNIRQLPRSLELYRAADLSPDSKEIVNFKKEYSSKAKISALCCWDTVGSLGVPDLIPKIGIDNLINKKYRFHNTHLSKIVQNAFHAVAIDENREVFDVTPMEPGVNFSGRLVEKWFPGSHGCIGGGVEAAAGFSDTALTWMRDKITSTAKLGLKIDFSRVPTGVNPSIKTKAGFDIANIKIRLFYRLMGTETRNIPNDPDLLHDSLKKLWDKNKEYRNKLRKKILKKNRILEFLDNA